MVQIGEQSLQATAVLYTPEMLRVQSEIHHRLLRETDFGTLERMTREALSEHIRRFADLVLADHDMTLPVRTLNQLVDAVINEIRGFGPLEVLLADDSISEIMVNGPNQVMIERSGRRAVPASVARPPSRSRGG